MAQAASEAVRRAVQESSMLLFFFFFNDRIPSGFIMFKLNSQKQTEVMISHKKYLYKIKVQYTYDFFSASYIRYNNKQLSKNQCLSN